MVDALLVLVYLGFATSAISVTLTRSDITREPRQWLKEKVPSLAGLIHCPYCTSHWVAMVLVLFYKPVVVDLFLPVDLAVSVMAVVGIAGVVSGILITKIPSLGRKED